MSNIKLIVFDLSGTTVEDDNAVAKSLHQAFVEGGFAAPLEDFQKTIGTNKIRLYQYMIAHAMGRQASFENLEKNEFPEYHDDALRIFDRYSVIMLDYYRQQVRAMPGAEETFAWCRANGIKVATDTGFHRDVNTAIMNGLQWRERGLVDLAVDVEHTGGVGRPAPFMVYYAMQQLNIQSIHEVVKIGDTPADLLSGYHAGCRGNIGVLSGANNEETLLTYPHTHLIGSVADLPAFIERFF